MTDIPTSKNKEAVNKMIVANATISTTLARIRELEDALKFVQARCEEMNKGFSSTVHLEVYRDAKLQPMRINNIFAEVANKIRSVL